MEQCNCHPAPEMETLLYSKGGVVTEKDQKLMFKDSIPARLSDPSIEYYSSNEIDWNDITKKLEETKKKATMEADGS